MRYLIFLLSFFCCQLYADTNNAPSILVFVSFSMPKESLKAWLIQAERVHAPVVVRGLVNNSFKTTVQQVSQLVKDNQGGIQIDPTLFQDFHIQKVPAVVVTQDSPCMPNQSCYKVFDVIYGDVTLEYALTKIAAQHDEVASIANEGLQRLRGSHEK